MRAYLQAHIEKFRTEPLISFRQVFVSTAPGRRQRRPMHGGFSRVWSPPRRGRRMTGDALLLGDAFTRTPLDRIAALFGDGFARGLAQSAPGVGSVRCDRPTGCIWSWSRQ